MNLILYEAQVGESHLFLIGWSFNSIKLCGFGFKKSCFAILLIVFKLIKKLLNPIKNKMNVFGVWIIGHVLIRTKSVRELQKNSSGSTKLSRTKTAWD